MKYENAKKIMLDNMTLLTQGQLRRMSDRDLGRLWKKVHSETCDCLGGYNSDGCNQLTTEYYRRDRIKIKKRKKKC